jgi:hypothetical protein
MGVSEACVFEEEESRKKEMKKVLSAFSAFVRTVLNGNSKETRSVLQNQVGLDSVSLPATTQQFVSNWTAILRQFGL